MYGCVRLLIRFFHLCVLNAWTIVTKLITGPHYQVHPHDTGDVFKVTGLKVKITDNICQKRTLQSEEYQWTFHGGRSSGL